MHISHFLGPFVCPWALGLPPPPNCCEECCRKRGRASLSEVFSFGGVYPLFRTFEYKIIALDFKAFSDTCRI